MLLAFTLALGHLQTKFPIAFESPTRQLKVEFDLKGGELVYSLKRGSKVLVEPSRLGLVFEDRDTLSDLKPELDMTGGNLITDKVKPAYAQAGVTVTVNSVSLYLTRKDGEVVNVYTRLSDSGFAWTQALNPKRNRHVNFDRAQWNLPKGVTLWTQNAGSAWGANEGIFSPSKGLYGMRSGPITADYGDARGFLLMTEVGNYDRGFGQRGFGGVKYRVEGTHVGVEFGHDPTGFEAEPEAEYSPWRVTIAARDLNELTTNGFIESLVPPAQGDWSWVKPGRSAWSWWDVYDVSYDAQKRYTDLASEFGFENNLIDEGWERWTTQSADKWTAPSSDKWANIKSLVEYGKTKGVNQWVWKRWSEIGSPDDNWKQMRLFLDKVKEVGVVGVKIDFMDSESQSRRRFYDAAMRLTAERHLMVNFHGANVPEGENVTYPNQITREGIFGLEQTGWTEIPPQHYAALPFTRLAVGPGDFTPGYFGHKPDRLDATSWCLQLATGVLYTSPALHWVSNPNDMRAAFPEGSHERDLITSIPSVWDETRVLPQSKIGGLVLMARRKGDTWFLAALNGGAPVKTRIPLTFLKDGLHDLVFVTEKGPADSWLVGTASIGAKDSIEINVGTGRGYVARFTPKK